MNQTNNTIQFSQFAAVSKDSDEVLGKILYYTLSSILIDREVLARLCDTVDFPYKHPPLLSGGRVPERHRGYLPQAGGQGRGRSADHQCLLQG